MRFRSFKGLDNSSAKPNASMLDAITVIMVNRSVNTFFNSIRKKMMALLLIATIVPILTSLVISYQYTKGKVTDKVIKENSNLLELGKTNILNYFDNINRLSLSIYSGINKPD